MNNQCQLASIIIPAFQPNCKLVNVIQAIRSARPEQPIIVVNDGSDEKLQAEVFDKLILHNVTVIKHALNLGKGEALKTGFNYYLAHTDNSSPGVVTADADGQHTAKDIITMCKALEKNQQFLHLGIRYFKNRAIPWRSRVGNILTGIIFRRITHSSLEDTQTGLRGIPRSFVTELVASKLSGYEFELEMLLQANREKIALNEIKIKTIYEDKNRSSHFNPLFDSLKIYFVFIRFTAISIISALLDFLLFTISYALFHKIFLAVVMARLLSAVFNFNLNKIAAFRSRGHTGPSAIKYALLAVALALTSYLVIRGIHSLSVNVYLSKVIAEIFLFIASFSIQKLFIFKPNPEIL